jgi:hypothetical protein
MDYVCKHPIIDTGIVLSSPIFPKTAYIRGMFKDEYGDFIAFDEEGKEAVILSDGKYLVSSYSQEYGTNHLLIEHAILTQVEDWRTAGK